MARYIVQLELVATRIPDAGSDSKPGADTMDRVADAALKIFNGTAPAVMGPPPGVTLRKSFPVTAESFGALCELLGRFDDLAERVECEHP
jgi:hypothetical protein